MGQWTARKLRAVVFDIGNVLIRWDPLPAVAAGVGTDQAAAFLHDADFDFLAWNHQQDAGRSWEEGEAAAIAAHPHWEAAIRAYRANFPASLIGPVDGTVEIVEELRAAGVPLFALTNWSAELFPEAVRRFAFLGVFEDIVVSGKERVAKPDPEIFALLARRLHHAGSLEELLFIDDGARNVQAARQAGMDAIVFTGCSQLRADLLVRGFPLTHAEHA